VIALNQRYGTWFVIELAWTRKKIDSTWSEEFFLCKCVECGNLGVHRTSNLIRSKSRPECYACKLPIDARQAHLSQQLPREEFLAHKRLLNSVRDEQLLTSAKRFREQLAAKDVELAQANAVIAELRSKVSKCRPA